MGGIASRADELRELFAQEAETRLTRLGEELLRLEEAGSDADLVASIFRDAHTLKGTAAVLGLADVARVAHAMEDLLEGIRSGHRLVTADLVDVLLGAVDGLRSMVPLVLEGRDVSSEAAVLEAAIQEGSVAPPAAAGEVTAPEAAPAPPRPVAERRVSEVVQVPVARLDELVRLVGESAAAQLRLGRVLAERLDVDPGSLVEFRDLSLVLNDLQERTMRARMVPVSTITDQLHRAVRDLSKAEGKPVRWEALGEETELDRSVLQQLADPLIHLVRNAVDHGIEPPAVRAAAGKPEQAVVRLHAMQLGSEVVMTITDDGGGIDLARVREEAAHRGADVASMSDEEALYLVFRSGLSTATFISDVSGRGVGLDAVRANVERVRGRIEVTSEMGVGTEFRLAVPITLAVLPCLLVDHAGRRYALPMHSVVLAQSATTETAHAEGGPVVWVGTQPVPLSHLGETLGGTGNGSGPVVVVAGLTRRHAFRVDGLLGQRDVVVKGLGRLLPRLDVLAGASVEPDGSILLVLDVPGLIDRARRARRTPGTAAPAPSAATVKRRVSILVVDDARTIRELQRSILDRAGYEVRVAGDGVEALAALAERPSDLVLTDVEMPRMDGFALTEAIRAQPGLANVPVVMLTSLASDEDRRRGLEAGADGYIVKSAFDEAALLDAVERLLGRLA